MTQKLEILSDAAKYDVSCSSSGVGRKGDGTGIGNASAAGICHSFSADGRCISLLKILFTNECIYDCKYCINRRSNDVPRASFTPDEICELTIQFYRRNYIEGLFLSSGIINSPTYTMELVVYRHAPSFVPAGQSTQMIVGATPESDYHLMMVTENLYKKFDLKRVYYSAFVNVNEDKELPTIPGGPPLLREHRLYQADWLLRFYGFEAKELLSEQKPNFNILLDPKADWALRHLELFPVEINRADYQTILRVPGIGVKSAQRIVRARRNGNLSFDDLKKIGVTLKRALYFITCSGKMMYPTKIEEDYITRNLISNKEKLPFDRDGMTYKQLSLFDDNMTFNWNQAVGG